MDKLFKTYKLNIELFLFSLMLFFSVIMNEENTEAILVLQQQHLIP